MKRILLFMAGSFFLFQANAQKTLDIETQILFPLDSAVHDPGTIQYSFRFHNHGPNDFVSSANDILYLSMTINGTPVAIQGSSMEFPLTGATTITAGNYYQYAGPFVFSADNPKYNEVCFTVEARNDSYTITDPDMGNNTDCRVLVLNVPDEPDDEEDEDPTNSLAENVISTLSIWPNPAEGIVNLDFTPDGNVNITTLDGKIVQNSEVVNNTIDVSKLPSGLYMMNFTLEGTPLKISLVVK